MADFQFSIPTAILFFTVVKVSRQLRDVFEYLSFQILPSCRRGVAQLGSAPALGAGGRRFKSCRPDHIPHSPDVFL